MGDKTKIEWCDASWNPVTGCSPCSPGCDHCYAAAMVRHFPHLHGLSGPHDDLSPVPFSRVQFHPTRLDQPLHWRRPRRIFVGSMTDLFQIACKPEWVMQGLDIMERAPQHTYLWLTKRAQNMRGFSLHMRQFPNNLWVGVTVCNQAEADAKIPVLLKTPAALRFVSVEPMLGPVDLSPWLGCQGITVCDVRKGGGGPQARGDAAWCNPPCPTFLDWVICGGETGPGARGMRGAWAAELKDACVKARVPFFYKGAGTAFCPKSSPLYHILHGQTWQQFPEVHQP